MLKREYRKLLSHHTSLRIGGPALCLVESENIDDLLQAVAFAKRRRYPVIVIGNGSNILAQDRGFDGVVIKLGRGFDYINKDKDNIVEAGSSVPLSRLIKKCVEWGLGGCEFLSGIPGSLGGAIFMNAGVRSVDAAEQFKEMKDIVMDVEVIDLENAQRERLERSSIPFTYRSSGLNGKCILGARLMLKEEEKAVVSNRISAFLKRREWVSRLGYPSAGSVFKNPDTNNPAGRLIEDCSLKGRRVGGAEISKAHANFIVNTGGAMSGDVMALIALARNEVKKKFDIELELELKVI